MFNSCPVAGTMPDPCTTEIMFLHKYSGPRLDVKGVVNSTRRLTDLRIQERATRLTCGKVTESGKVAIVVIRVHDHGCRDLAEVAQAGGASSLFPRFIQRRQEHRGENADDRDDDKEFN